MTGRKGEMATNKCNAMKSANILGIGFMSLQAFEQGNPPRASALQLKMVTGLNGREDSVHFGPGVAFSSSKYIKRGRHGILVYPARHLIFFAEYTDMENRAIP